MNGEPMEDINAVVEELDRYGGHLPVAIESRDGNLFELDEVTTRPTPNGPVVVFITGLKRAE